jgi:hypothetical protein
MVTISIALDAFAANRIFLREPYWQDPNAGDLPTSYQIAMHSPLSGIAAAAAIIRNYSLGPPVILKALELQPPLPDDALKIVASGEKEDGVAERVSI